MTALWTVEAAALAYACGSYNIAVDPDANYTRIAQIKPISLPDMDALPDSSGKRLAQGWVEMLEAQKAMGESLGRYEGAKEAGNEQWAFLQLVAARKYHGTLMNALTKVKNETTILIQELEAVGFILTQADIDTISAQFLNDGLPEIEKNILAKVGFSQEDIANAGQVTASMMKYTPLNWQAALNNAVQSLIVIHKSTGDWGESKISTLGQSYTYAEIDVKPDSFPNSINPTSQGKIPVAIFSVPAFNALTKVDTTSLTFGHTGDEPSLHFCNTNGEDVNGDGLLDLVCHFNTKKTGFQKDNAAGVLKGKTVEGTTLIGADSVLIVP